MPHGPSSRGQFCPVAIHDTFICNAALACLSGCSSLLRGASSVHRQEVWSEGPTCRGELDSFSPTRRGNRGGCLPAAPAPLSRPTVLDLAQSWPVPSRTTPHAAPRRDAYGLRYSSRGASSAHRQKRGLGVKAQAADHAEDRKSVV